MINVSKESRQKRKKGKISNRRTVKQAINNSKAKHKKNEDFNKIEHTDTTKQRKAYMTLTLTLMIQDSSPSSHRTIFRFSKLKLIGLGGMGMVPIRSLL